MIITSMFIFGGFKSMFDVHRRNKRTPSAKVLKERHEKKKKKDREGAKK